MVAFVTGWALGGWVEVRCAAIASRLDFNAGASFREVRLGMLGPINVGNGLRATRS